MVKSGVTFCPIHEYERYACGPECRERRREFKQIIHGFNVLWHDRLQRGVSYVSLAELRRCPMCHHVFRPLRGNQRCCTVECRRRGQWIRRYDRLRAA